MKKLLPIFSYIFHPLFMSVYAVLIFFIFGTPYFMYPEIYLLIIQTAILTVFLPISFMYLLISMNKVDSIMIDDKRQRKIPLFIHSLLLLFLIKKGMRLDFYPELYYFFLGSLISTVTALSLIYMNIKASLHMIGIAGVTVFTIALSMHFRVGMVFLIAFLILCNGLVASSRLVMKAHTYRELFLGSLIGIIPQIIGSYFWI